jgi:ribonuclease HI
MAKEVSIYIATTIRTPRSTNGWIAYTLEYYPEGQKMPHLRWKYRYMAKTTSQRAVMIALARSLSLLKVKSLITIYTDSPYLYNGLTSWVRQWEANDWKNVKGEEVKNAEVWQWLSRVLKAHEGYEVMFHMHNAYTPTLEEDLAALKAGTVTIEQLEMRHNKKG